MVELDEHDTFIESVPDLSAYDHVGAGPGLGTENATQTALRQLLSQAKAPMVLDADALNILAQNKSWLKEVPKNSILTPHPGEFKRLAGKSDNDFEQLEQQCQLAEDHQIYLILKRAHTVIACPDGTCYFNTTGNPGMATGGAGDVLTGMLTGLLCQGYSPLDSARIGVYLHGLAGDIAACKETPYSVTANSIIENIGQAYSQIRYPAND
jgi:NAD(P)H-hydrate epimerase